MTEQQRNTVYLLLMVIRTLVSVAGIAFFVTIQFRLAAMHCYGESQPQDNRIIELPLQQI